MHFTTLYRFAKKFKFQKDTLDEPLVKYVLDRDNLGDIYKALQKYHTLINTRKKAGMSHEKLLRVLNNLETAPNEVLDWVERV